MEQLIYNESIANLTMVPGVGIQYTYGDLLKQYSEQFLNHMLTLNILILIFNLFILYFTFEWEVKTYKEIFKKKATRKEIKDKILKSGAFICSMISLYLVLMLLEVKYG